MAFVILLLAPLVGADDECDYIEARQLLDSGKILPLEEILEKVRQKFPGKVLEVELEKEDQQIVYEIEILGSNGIVNEIYVDARTGELLLAEEYD